MISINYLKINSANREPSHCGGLVSWVGIQGSSNHHLSPATFSWCCHFLRTLSFSASLPISQSHLALIRHLRYIQNSAP